MSEILRKWLSERLGVIVDLNLLSFGEIAKDAYLIAQLLCNYGILDCDVLDTIVRSDDQELCYLNLKNINNILASIGIQCTEKTLRSIAGGEGSTAMKLFYQLYLTLNSKNKLHFTTTLMLKNDDFTVKPEIVLVTEEGDAKEHVDQEMQTNKAIINWHKNKYLDLTKKCKAAREKYVEFFESKIKNSEIVPDKKYEVTKISDVLDEVIDKQSDGENLEDLEISCEPDKTNAKEYSKLLKEKSRKQTEYKTLQTYMQKILLSDLLKTLINKQDKEFNNTITSKLLKQSYYEKQMVTKLLEIKKQKETIIENRKLENEVLLQKGNEDFMEQVFQQQHNVSLAALRNENERKRILELHRKLYAEKQQKRYTKHYSICYDVVSDFVDLAIKRVEYNYRYNMEVPPRIWQEWVSLFCAEEQIMDNEVDIQEILSAYDEEEENEEMINELCRQDQLDEKDLFDYINLEWPWCIEDVSASFIQDIEIIALGANILGYIVYRLLLAKYPLPQSQTVPDLHPVTTACAVLGIKDDSLITILERVLMKQSIIVLTTQLAVNYCLEAYMKETGKDIDAKLNEETAEAKKGSKKKKGTQNKPKSKGKKSKANKSNKTVITDVVGTDVKQTQTPKLFPDEEIKLTPQAQLGQYAYETLNLGLPLNNYLTSCIIVEYLKTFKTIHGWVLVNYPEHIGDAVCLELCLTGKEMKDVIRSNENVEFGIEHAEYLRSEVFTIPEDVTEYKRKSKLVINPPPISRQETYIPYLSSFIRLMKQQEATTEDIIIEPIEIVENFTEVVSFYEQFNCSNNLVYTLFDPRTITELVKLILGDNLLGEALYEDIVRIVLEVAAEKERALLKSLAKKIEKPKKGSKKDKGSKDKKKKEKGKKGKKAKSTEQTKEEPKPEEIKPPVQVIVEIIPKPGEPNWIYCNLHQPVDIQINLASFWEDVENIYINDFKQVFFLIRRYKNSINPYIHEIDTHTMDFIARPDDKQNYLHNFQKTYNVLPNDLREDEEFKVEMYCRITEFRTRLWDICLVRLKEAEEERIRIINENWFYELILEMTNTFISALQLEIDRCYNTLSFLQDYYVSMVNQAVSDNKFTKLSLAPQKPDKNLPNFTIQKYSDINEVISLNPFSSYMESLLKTALQAINVWYSSSTSYCKTFESLGAAKTKVDKKSKKVKKKAPPVEPGFLIELKNNMSKLIDEWQCAIEGEYLRIKHRLNLLNTKANLDIKIILLNGQNLFHKIHKSIERRYNDEVDSVNAVCEILYKATEACESIQPRLVLDGSRFYIDGNALFYDDPMEITYPFNDDIQNKYFSSNQLTRLIKIILDLAPNGSLPMKTFIYLLQDIITNNNANSDYKLLPAYWQFMDPSQLQEVIYEIYGNVEYISWKDFIVYNFELPFPTEMQLLKMRKQFRDMDVDKLEFVNEIQFDTVEFWFNQCKMRLSCNTQSIKNMLEMMFKISEDRINYSALLLTFCKDRDPMIGFAKGLGLCIGKLICHNLETGNNYIEILRYQRYLEEKNKQESVEGESMYNLDCHQINSPASQTKVPSTSVVSSPRDYFNRDNISVDAESIILDDFPCEDEEMGLPDAPPQICYVLPFNIILAIITASLPWHVRIQNAQDDSLRTQLQEIYESVRNEEFDVVFAHEFLNCESFKEFLALNYKFNTKSPMNMVQDRIEKCTCNKDTVSDL